MNGTINVSGSLTGTLSNPIMSGGGGGVTYTLAQDGDTITLTGSDGTTSSVTVTSGAPEASSEVIADVLGGMD